MTVQTEKEVEVVARKSKVDTFKLEVPKATEAFEQADFEEVINSSGVEDEQGKVQTITKLEEKVIKDLDDQVDKIMNDLLATPANSPEMKDITSALNRMGDVEIGETSRVSNRMLSRPMRGLKENEFGQGDLVMKGLKDLRTKVMDLDPSRRDKLFSKQRFLGIKLPFGIGNKIDSYFQEYKSSESAISDIIKSLTNGKDELLQDNAHIDEERETMHKMMVRLEQYAYIMKRINKKIEERLPEIAAEDNLKAEDIKQEILFPVKQKQIDLLSHLAVSMQGYMALQVVKSNNLELIRGVDRAKNTTTAALRTAIMVSQALGTQKLVLDQINQVNTVTDNLILRNAKMLEQQGVAIQKQAVESAISVETLEQAFKSIFKAMDDIDTYRSNALPEMQKTVDSLENSVKNAKNYLSSRREERIGDFTKEIMKSAKEPEVKDSGIVSIRSRKGMN